MRFGRCDAPPGRRRRRSGALLATVWLIVAAACAGTPTRLHQAGPRHSPDPNNPSAAETGLSEVALRPRDGARGRGGVIRGQVMKDDGGPFAGATVTALLMRSEEGVVRMIPIATATADDRGEFRLTGLAAGRYHVSAFDPSFAEVGDDRSPKRYAPTYYPGVVFIETATAVTVPAQGAANVAATFKLHVGRSAQLSGRLAMPDGRPLSTATVMLTPLHHEGLPAEFIAAPELRPDGRFTFRNVPAGAYEIRATARGESAELTHIGTYRVRVNGRDLSMLDISLRPGPRLDAPARPDTVARPAAPR